MAWASFFLFPVAVALFALVGKGRSAAAWWLMTMLAQLPLWALIYEGWPRFETVRAAIAETAGWSAVVVGAFMAVIIAFLPGLSRR